MIMDCGEGAFTQMCRLYGKQSAMDILRRLKCLFISHKHPDHLRGVLQLLSKRAEALNLDSQQQGSSNGRFSCPQCKVSFSYSVSLQRHILIHTPQILDNIYKQSIQQTNYRNSPVNVEDWKIEINPEEKRILVIGPMWCETLLQEYSQTVEPLYYQFIDADLLFIHNTSLNNYFQKELGISEMKTAQVVHSFPAYAIAITTPEWKLVYSGDTRPCEELIELGKNATFLIHEANFEENMKEKAVKDRHSTTLEAISTGQKNECKVYYSDSF